MVRKFFLGFGAILFLLLQYQLWIAPGNLLEIWQIHRSIDSLEKENHQLLERNNHLVADIQDLKAGEDSIEERARYELGMVKPGEELYLIESIH